MEQHIKVATLCPDSVIGASHIRKGLCCEDCAGAITGDHYTIACVADGHGAANHCRSFLGSQFAVEEAIKCTAQMFDALLEDNGALRAADIVSSLNLLRKRILTMWRRRVNRHFRLHPFDPEHEVKKPKPEMAQEYAKGKSFFKMYGSTLNLVAYTNEMWFSLKLGDGICALRMQDAWWLIVPSSEFGQTVCATVGEVEQADGDAADGEVTDSLCSSSALSRMVIHFGLLGDADIPTATTANVQNMYNVMSPRPLALVVNTDGVDKCYSTPRRLLRFYEGVARNSGINVEGASEAIPELLRNMSDNGSQDDMSLAMIIDASQDWKSLDDLRVTAYADKSCAGSSIAALSSEHSNKTNVSQTHDRDVVEFNNHPIEEELPKEESGKEKTLVAERNPQAMPVVGGWFHPAGFG